MTCPIKQDEQILLEYCSGTLDARRADQMESHAAECAECANYITGQRAVWGALDEFPAPEIRPDFNARLYQRIAQERNGGWWKQFWRTAWKPALVTAAAGVALAIGLTVGMPHSSDTSDAPKKASVENIDINQVEHVLEDLDLLTPADAGNKL